MIELGVIVYTIGGVPYVTFNDAFEGKNELTYKVDTMRINVRSMSKPPAHAEIIVTDGTDKKFAGIVVGSTLLNDLDGIWEVIAYDYSKRLDSKLVIEEYTGQTGDYIVNDIITKYVDPEFSASGVETGAPTIDFIQFNDVKVSEAIIRVCNRVGWQFYVDYEKVIHFFSPETLLEPAPEEITSIYQIEGLEYDLDVSDLRNRVKGLGGSYLSDLNPYYSEKSDGVKEIWILPHEFYNLSMKVNEVSVTVGIENVDDTASYDFLSNSKERRVSLASGTKPTEGPIIEWAYQYKIPIVTVAENLESQAAIALIQGGDGVYEDKVSDDTLVTIEAVEALAQGVIDQYSDPYIKGSYVTRTAGYIPGQMLKINLPALGIVNTYMVQAVYTRFRKSVWEYIVYFGGKLIGVEDYLQALITNQQNAARQRTEILQKYIYVNEYAYLADELTLIERDFDEPWYVEESVKRKLSNESVSFDSVGSYMIATVNGNNGSLQYRFDAGSWVDWSNNVLVDVPHPCVIEVNTAGIAEVRNWKVPYDETDVITGEVVVIG